MLLALALLAYPLVVYLLIDQVSPLALAGMLALVTAIRLMLAKHLSKRAIALGLTTVAVVGLAIALRKDTDAIKLYPVVWNGACALWCAYTLFYPPNAIERLLNIINRSRAGLPERMRERIPFDTQGLAPSSVQLIYLRRLTALWMSYFVVNAAASAATAVFTSTAIWALYTGVIGYLLAGVLVVAELFYRPFYQLKHEGSPGAPVSKATEILR